jgi:hypothetical protein
MKPMKTRYKNLSLFFSICIMIFIGCSNQKKTITFYCENISPQVQFGREEIRKSLADNNLSIQQGDDVTADIVFISDTAGLTTEGFHIQKKGNRITVTAGDDAGFMYGALELAEQIKLYGLKEVQETTQNPYMEIRGTKFNIPLDVRTPSYTDASEAAQKNIPEMWSFDFWQEYIDNLARYRYNLISLWSLHPFPSMVRVPGYEDIALDDVLRSTVEWQEHYDLEATGLDTPEIMDNAEVVKKISMDEKIEFWRKVMRYAKERNIRFYVVTWNIFTNGTYGKYGITDKADNPVTTDYFRKSVKQMLLTYPDLAGIGLTTGENMKDLNFQEKEEWAYETYATGVMDAAAEMPERKIAFIHRQHMAGAKDIADKFKPVIEDANIEFLFSFKYAQAHVMSALKQPFHEGFVNDIAGMKTLWTLRNDDNYQYRWGAPGFVREFIQNIPHDVSKGFYYGSDQWVWGREFLMKDAEEPRKIEIVKHWYHWMMWGRLGFNPNLEDDRFIHILQNRFPMIDGQKLFTAWQEASMIYPVTTGFHWGALDFQWYIEACKSRPAFAQNETGFHDVNRFINLLPHKYSGYQSIPDFVKGIQPGQVQNQLNPIQVSALLHTHSDKALELLQELNPDESAELKAILHDIHSMAYLGKYYAHKISGATHLALFRESKQENSRMEAINELEKALQYWEQYTASALQKNKNPLWLNRVGIVDWEKITEWVKQDIEIAKAG